MFVYYEGSPELGYASEAQLIEFTANIATNGDSARLFPVSDPLKVNRLGKRVFRQMKGPQINSYLGPNKAGSFLIFKDQEELGIDTYEVGVRNEDPELGDLINLDFLHANFRDRHFTASVKPIVEQYIAKRIALLGIDKIV